MGIAIVYVTTSNYISQDYELITLIHNSLLEVKSINFGEKITTKWDRLLIVRPYSNLRQIFEYYDLSWRPIKTNIEILDWYSLLIFLYKNEVVTFINYPRNKGDFSCYSNFKGENRILLSRDNTRFVYEAMANFEACIRHYPNDNL